MIYVKSARLQLRQFTPDDLDSLVELDSDPLVMKWTRPRQGLPDRDAYARELIPRFMDYYAQGPDFGFWAAIEKSGNTFIGWFHLRPSKEAPHEIELGYRFLERGRNQGYATDGSKLLLHRGFVDLGLPYIMATTLFDNAASIRVMEKVGMTFEKEFVYPQLAMKGVKYSIRRDAYLKLQMPR